MSATVITPPTDHDRRTLRMLLAVAIVGVVVIVAVVVIGVVRVQHGHQGEAGQATFAQQCADFAAGDPTALAVDDTYRRLGEFGLFVRCAEARWAADE